MAEPTFWACGSWLPNNRATHNDQLHPPDTPTCCIDAFSVTQDARVDEHKAAERLGWPEGTARVAQNPSYQFRFYASRDGTSR